jgi:uroporphyrinogen-III synthase
MKSYLLLIAGQKERHKKLLLEKPGKITRFFYIDNLYRKLCMTLNRPLALITRPIYDAKITASYLTTIGINSHIEPLLEVSYNNSTGQLLTDTANISAIIVTSANALYALEQFSDMDKSIPIITVGKHSSDIAHQLNYTNVNFADGNIESLEYYINNSYSAHKNFIYASADHITREINLPKHNVRRIIVYKTNAIDRLSDATIRLLENKYFSCILFYSSRTAGIFSKLAQSYDFSQTIAFCTSKNVTKQLSSLHFMKIISPEESNSKSLLELIENFKFI